MKVKILSNKLTLGNKDEIIELDQDQAKSLINSGHVKEIKVVKKNKGKK